MQWLVQVLQHIRNTLLNFPYHIRFAIAVTDWLSIVPDREAECFSPVCLPLFNATSLHLYLSFDQFGRLTNLVINNFLLKQ